MPLWFLKTPDTIGEVSGSLYGRQIYGGITPVQTHRDRDFLLRRGFTDVTGQFNPAAVPEPPMRDIVVARHGGAGDMMMVTPFLEAIKLRWPQATLTMYSLGTNATVLEHDPNVDQFNSDILIVDGARALDEPDEAFDLTHIVEFNHAAELENGYERPCSKYGLPPTSYAPRYVTTPGERIAARELLFSELKLQRSQRTIACQLDASSGLRTLPITQSLQMVEGLSKLGNVVVFGNRAHTLEQCELVTCSKCKAAGYVHLPPSIKALDYQCPCGKKSKVTKAAKPENVHYLGTSRSLRQVGAMLGRCDLLVAVDSGLMHMAAGQGTPVFLLSGAFDAHLTAGTFPNTHVHQQPYPCAPCHLHAGKCFRMQAEEVDHAPCMAAIPVPAVLERISSLLSTPGALMNESPDYNWRPKIPAREEWRTCPFCEGEPSGSVARKGEFLHLLCGNCRAVYTHTGDVDPLKYQDQAATKAYVLNKVLGKWETELGNWLVGEAVKHCGGRQPKTLMDLGAGYGHLLKGMAKGALEGAEVLGVEIAEHCVAHARGEGLTVVAGNLNEYMLVADDSKPLATAKRGKLYLRAGGFDFISMFHVFEHMRDQYHIASMLKNILAPDGVLFIACPGADHFKRGAYITTSPLINRTFAGEHTALPTQAGMLHLMRRVGLECVAWDSNFQPGDKAFASWWKHA